MNQEIARRSITETMAHEVGMEAAAFEATLRATVFPSGGSREQFAAFLLVAKQYKLNPVTKEIFAFPAKGGIIPVVSVDGWANLINSHPAMDGLEFDDHLSPDGKTLVAITARIWRKDRAKPIVVTEYMVECARSTDPWKQWPRRMLRHKAMIQCARYAFGFSGIVDPDEAERTGADVSPMKDVQRPPTAPPPQRVIEAKAEPTIEAVNVSAVQSALDAPAAEVATATNGPVAQRESTPSLSGGVVAGSTPAGATKPPTTPPNGKKPKPAPVQTDDGWPEGRM